MSSRLGIVVVLLFVLIAFSFGYFKPLQYIDKIVIFSQSAMADLRCDLRKLVNFPCEVESVSEYAVVVNRSHQSQDSNITSTTTVVVVDVNSSAPTAPNTSTSQQSPSVIEREIIREINLRDGSVDTSNFITRSEYNAQIDALLTSIERSGGTTVINSGGGGGAVDSVNGQTGTVTLNTDDIPEGSNQYFTTERSRSVLSVSSPALSYSTTTGILLVTAGYDIPLSASTTEWALAHSWGNHATQNYIQQNTAATTTNLTVTGSLTTNLLDGCVEIAGGVLTSTGSNCGTGGGGIANLNGLTASSQSFATSSTGNITIGITSSAGVHTFTTGVAAGYSIPLTASSTAWNTFYNTPSTRITAGTNLQWSGNTLNFIDPGYLTSISTSTVRNMFSAGAGLSYSTTTGQFANTGVTSIGGLTGDISTSSLGISSSNWNVSGDNVYRVDGNVSTGTSSPLAKLTIQNVATYGSELITNGTFDSDASGWTLSSSCATWNAGAVDVLYDAGCQGDADWPSAYTEVNLVSGSTYRLTFDVVTNGDSLYVYADSTNLNTDQFSDGSHSIIFTSTYTGTDTLYFESWNWNSDGSFTIDNVSLQELTSGTGPALALYNINGAATALLGQLNGNVAIGVSALSGVTGSSMTGIGSNAGNNATNASNSNFFGYNAGQNAINANNSNFFGNSAGYEATNAASSNFFGASAGYSATWAASSNFFGPFAGYEATNAASSNFFGSSAGSHATDAADSNFLGTSAGYSATNANNSNFLGKFAGYEATSAYYSNFFGSYAGYSASSAYYSNFFGSYAGYSASSAPNSNFLGYSAGYSATNATYSNFLGYSAGYSATNAARSIFIGDNAGLNDTVDNTGGGTSIAIGSYSGTGGFSNSIALGHGSINSATNQLNLGNVLYATGLRASDTQSASPISNGRIGIGTSTPSRTLTIANSSGNASIGLWTSNSGVQNNWTLSTDWNISGGKFQIANADGIGSNNFLTIIAGSGNVGIGTTTPSSKLTVVGNAWIGGNLTATGTLSIAGLNVNGGATSTFAGDIEITGDIVPSLDDTYSLGTPDRVWRDVYIGPGSLYINGKKVLQDISDTVVISTDEDQNLRTETTGIGSATLRATGTGNVVVTTVSGNLNLNSTSGNVNLGTTGSGLLNLGTVASGVWHGTEIDISDYTNLTVSATGLQLSGDALALASGYSIPLVASTTEWANKISSQWVTGASSSISYVGGNVGIGTTTPVSPFHLVYTGADLNFSGQGVLNINTQDSLLNHSPAFQVRLPSTGQRKAFQLVNGTDTTAWASFEYQTLGGGVDSPGFALGPGGDNSALRDVAIYRSATSTLSFYTGTSTSMTINGNGFVGIGTTTPSSKLTVAGSASFDFFNTSSTTATSTIAGNLQVNGQIKVGTSSLYLTTDSIMFGLSAGLRLNGDKIQFKHADGSWQEVGAGAGSGWSNDGTQSYLASSTTLVAIGTSTAAAKLDIWGNASSSILNLSSSNGTRVMTVDNTGNLALGTSTSSAKLDVWGSAGSQNIFAISSSTGERYITVTASGYFGLGTSTPSRRLTVFGTAAEAQQRLAYDATRYSELYVDAVGDLNLLITGSTLRLGDSSIEVCTGGACPSVPARLGNTGNVVAENTIIANDIERHCATGYVWVPGSAKYGTMPGFCVMKYEARNDGSNNAISTGVGTPWVSISQTNARLSCESIGPGYHLVSEPEWMTMAEQIARLPINDLDLDAGLQLGTGHSDNSPPNALDADTPSPATRGCNLMASLEHSSNAVVAGECELRNYTGGGYYGTNNDWSDTGYFSGGHNKSQIRTFVLSNGEVVWDLAGNVWEWTDELAIQNNVPTDATPAAEWLEYTAITNYGSYPGMRPANDSWSSTNGIGRLYSQPTGTSVRGFRRGGSWEGTSYSGVFSLSLNDASSNTGAYIGFRCAK